LNILSVCTTLPTKRYPVRGTFVLRRLEKLAEHGELRVLIPQPWFPVLRSKHDDPPVQNANVQVDTVPMFYFPGIAKNLDGRFMQYCVEKWLDQADKEYLEDLVIDAHFGYPEGVGCYYAAKRRGIPVFITMRGLEVDLFRIPKRRRQLVEALQCATGVIAVSHSLRNAAVEAGIDGNRITVIPNGVDASIYHRGNKRAAREKVGFREDRPLLLCVANLKPIKGHDVLLQAMGQLVDRTDAKLVCIGKEVDLKWTREVKRSVSRLGLSDRVSFVGPKPRQEIADWLRASDIFTLASHREGCCNAVLEALSSGTPVVATRVGDNGRFVVEGVSGRLVDPGEPTSLAHAIETALQDKYDEQQISASVRDYTWEQAASSVRAYMESTIQRKFSR